MDKVALITGASSGIGEACAKRLLSLGYKVHGIARDFTKLSWQDPNFLAHSIDLINQQNYPKLPNISVLIHAAGIGHFGPHENLSISMIEEIIQLNLTAPLLLSRYYLPSLKKNRGYIFNIGSISGKEPALFGAAYGASKAGLHHFGTSLFKEARKSGLKVINITPDITKTPFFDDLHFRYSDDTLAYIEADDIALVVEDVLAMREGTVLSDITIQPQKFQIKKKK